MNNERFFRFSQLQPDGSKALRACEHIDSYFEGCLIQYNRIYELWKQVSQVDDSIDIEQVFKAKHTGMKQVVRDIHFLLISLQVVWKSLQQLADKVHYPNFVELEYIKNEWSDYFEQYREPRNTFEHYDDQIFGPDSRNNSPGFGLKLTSDGGFSLGTHNPVLINKNSMSQLEKFKDDFDSMIDRILPNA
jgi:hypothetical protein